MSSNDMLHIPRSNECSCCCHRFATSEDTKFLILDSAVFQAQNSTPSCEVTPPKTRPRPKSRDSTIYPDNSQNGALSNIPMSIETGPRLSLTNISESGLSAPITYINPKNSQSGALSNIPTNIETGPGASLTNIRETGPGAPLVTSKDTKFLILGSAVFQAQNSTPSCEVTSPKKRPRPKGRDSTINHYNSRNGALSNIPKSIETDPGVSLTNIRETCPSAPLTYINPENSQGGALSNIPTNIEIGAEPFPSNVAKAHEITTQTTSSAIARYHQIESFRSFLKLKLNYPCTKLKT